MRSCVYVDVCVDVTVLTCMLELVQSVNRLFVVTVPVNDFFYDGLILLDNVL